MAIYDDSSDSDAFLPVGASQKGNATTKPSPKKAVILKTSKVAPKKTVQTTLKTTLKTTKTILQKRPKPGSDNEDSSSGLDSAGDASLLSNTPPSSKKQKKRPAKKLGREPLQDIANESIDIDGPTNTNSKKSASDHYQKLTQLEHIITRPDSYIGSVEQADQQLWVFNSEVSQMELRKVSFVPGLYKIFDEILVNAADNKQQDPSMKYIKVVVNRESGEISVENDGAGIPVEIHEKEKIYIPEMIFGHLLTGSNYDDDKAKTTGGRNGYGAKLCNIFSTEFTIETQDSIKGKRYKQTWTNNMSCMGKAKISSSKSASFTRVTFTPDWKRFQMTGIDDDFEALLKRRVYDMAGTVKGVKVFLNGTQIKLDFKKYIEMYAKAINSERGVQEAESSSVTVIVDDDKSHVAWQVGFAVSDGSFGQVSFVNSIATTSGGTHVNYIADQICDKLMDVVRKRNSKGAALKLNQIRNHIFLFVNCWIVNPAFASQTKEQLTTRVKQFGSKCTLTEEFLKKIAKTDAVNNILNFAATKADQVLAKSDGNKRSRMNNPKLVDANLAGSRRGHECTLILTEGDSAKGLAVAGRAILDPDRIGVFPLRGKLLNVRDASIDQISKNAEIQNIKQFLGLKHKQVYKDTAGLRYGHLMIMADQDHDGSHIKGLLINFLQVQFPSLLKLPDFFRVFITPIVKVWKGPNPKRPIAQKSFFTMPQYEEWKVQHGNNNKNWRHKYYKGLGTSAPEDAQVYFSNLDDHLREFETMKAEEEDLIDLAFSKKKADARKQWLGNFVPGTYLDHSTKTLTYGDFVNKELILFSMADNLRSIPSVIDGLKPGQRKVMYACFKRNLVRDMKVVELSGYVSQTTAYHHGEQSMHMTIIGLAQNFVGSNNVNCLEPSGSFGSRLAGGSDAASPRYIFTRLSPFARRVFSALDEPVYDYNTDDGRQIEPTMYCPVVPMVLLNGADGIGTGWSTTIPNYHPVDIVNNLKRRMGRLDGSEEKPFQTMMPWFRGWKGTPEEAGPDRFKFNGSIKETGNNEVEITELPIRVWTDDFKAKLEEIIKAEKVPSFIKDYKEFNDHKNVHFVIQLDEKHMKAALAEGLAEKFKLNKTIATSNLVAFDTNGRIRKYEKVEEILEEYYVFRLTMYSKRKAYWLQKIHSEYRKLQNQARFVTEIIDNKLLVSRKKKPILVSELREREYEPFPKVKGAQKAGETEDAVEDEEEGGSVDEDSGAGDFDYLLGLPIWSLTQERVDKLKAQMLSKKEEHDALEKVSEKDLWCQDLDSFIQEWELQLKEDADYEKTIRNTNRRASRKIGAGKNDSKARAKKDDDYNPKPTKASSNKDNIKPENKSHERFLNVFENKPISKPKPALHLDEADGFEMSGSLDDDFDSMKPTKSIKQTSRQETKNLPPSKDRTKRAAAAVPKTWVIDDDEESESDVDKLLGDVGHMVKGVGIERKAEDKITSNGNVSLSAVSSLGGSHRGQTDNTDLHKAKVSKTFELAKLPSHKATSIPTETADAFFSDNDDFMPMLVKKGPLTKAAAKPTQKPKKAPSSKRVAPVSQPNPMALSPAAKAYVAKQDKVARTSRNAVFSVHGDDDAETDEAAGSSLPRPVVRGRPARAAAVVAKKKTIIQIDSDDDVVDVDSLDESAVIEDELTDDEEDDFDVFDDND